MKSKIHFHPVRVEEPGTPFDPFGDADNAEECNVRIVLSPFDYPAYPSGIALIRNLGLYRQD